MPGYLIQEPVAQLDAPNVNSFELYLLKQSHPLVQHQAISNVVRAQEEYYISVFQLLET